MPGDPLRAAARHRLFLDPDLRAQHAHRHFELGFFLDQPGVDAGASVARTADRAGHEHALDRCARLAATRVLHQSHRRVAVGVPNLRLLIAH